CVFFFNDTPTPEIYTLSLHDALPISHTHTHTHRDVPAFIYIHLRKLKCYTRSEEHTSELQSHLNLVCRPLLHKNTHVRICACLFTCTHAHAPFSSHAHID